MTMAASQTRTAGVTATDVREVMVQIRADLRTLRAMHRMITETTEAAYAADLTKWVYRGYVTDIQFWYFEPTGTPRYGTSYALDRQWAGRPAGEAGGLEFVNLAGTTFHLRVTYSTAWQRLGARERQEFYQTLALPWGSAPHVQTSGGSWTTDRTYASGALAATRSVYRAG
jgi:hypothetical protein